MVIELTDEDGELAATVHLPRPCHHSLLMAYLLRWQDECREEESGPRDYSEPLQFPVR